MVIIMKSHKNLVISKPVRIYQKENLVDECIFYIPQTYNGLDLSQYALAMYYVNPGNEPFTEILELQDESDKDKYLMYKLPITTQITKLAGEITLHLSFLDVNQEQGTTEVLRTGELKFKVLPFTDYYAFVADESFSGIDQRILELKNTADELANLSETMEKEIPNDLLLTDDTLQLAHDGEAIGEGVEILVYGSKDEDDGSKDGIIDLDSEDEGGDDDPQGYAFVEL